MYKDSNASGERSSLQQPPTRTGALVHGEAVIQPEHTSGSATALAWAAGLCDGEGCINISKHHMPGRKNPTYRLRLELGQNHLETLHVFRATLALHGAPCSLHAVKRTAQHSRQVYTLSYDGRHAARALTVLRPYLVRKAPEADAALQYVAVAEVGRLPGPSGLSKQIWETREAYHQLLRRLK